MIKRRGVRCEAGHFALLSFLFPILDARTDDMVACSEIDRDGLVKVCREFYLIFNQWPLYSTRVFPISPLKLFAGETIIQTVNTSLRIGAP